MRALIPIFDATLDFHGWGLGILVDFPTYYNTVSISFLLGPLFVSLEW